jgi:hypothetical protein
VRVLERINKVMFIVLHLSGVPTKYFVLSCVLRRDNANEMGTRVHRLNLSSCVWNGSMTLLFITLQLSEAIMHFQINYLRLLTMSEHVATVQIRQL